MLIVLERYGSNMPMIRIVATIDTDDIDDDQVDLSHPTGLTEDAFIAYVTGERALFLSGDAEFVLQD